MQHIVAVLILLWLFIYPVTDIYVRFLRRRTLRRSFLVREVFLTFDDGPDPRYLPRLLSILRQYQLPAFFFLITNRAEDEPELVDRILTEGHGIGLHSSEHRHAYLIWFRKSLRSIFEARQRLEKLVKHQIHWFRPPWGAVNLFQLWAIHRAGLQLALWDVNASDWEAEITVEQITKHILAKAREGSIIVLHDAGGDPGAPDKMLQALPLAIEGLRSLGYSFRRLDQAGEGQWFK